MSNGGRFLGTNCRQVLFFGETRSRRLLLSVTSVFFSRLLFVFARDPEGPNLVIVMAVALLILTISNFVCRLLLLKVEMFRNMIMLVAILTQAVAAVALTLVFA